MVAARTAKGGSRPKLATVVIGDDPASDQYVRMKQANAKQVGIDSDDHRLPAATTTEQLVGRFYLTTAIDYANGDPHLGHALEEERQPERQQQGQEV